MSYTKHYSEHTRCRICGSVRLTKYIDLGYLPLSNNLLYTPYDIPERFPLQVLFCEDCTLSQLSIVVDRKILFENYVYRSSINGGYVSHCRRMAESLAGRYQLDSKSKMIDIAGNDGALLNQFRQQIGIETLNVDPAKNLIDYCEKSGIKTINEFWSYDLARSLANTSGKVDLITATNVFAHVDDVKDFMEGVKKILQPGGVLILEFPYLLDFIQNREFDTIYFEHLSYMSIGPLKRLCDEIGLTVMDVERQDIHGGSVRVHIGWGRQQKVVEEMIRVEKHYTLSDYFKFGIDSWKQIYNFADRIRELKSDGYKISAFAASAKGSTLLNTAQINFNYIDRIIDETPEKIGKYAPGVLIKIHPLKDLGYYPCDYLVILSWNFKEEIIEKAKSVGYAGKYIIPIPDFTITANQANIVSVA